MRYVGSVCPFRQIYLQLWAMVRKFQSFSSNGNLEKFDPIVAAKILVVNISFKTRQLLDMKSREGASLQIMITENENSGVSIIGARVRSLAHANSQS